MVKQVQLIDEYYQDDDDEDDSDLFYAPSYYETDEQLVIVACLILLRQKYLELKSMTPSEVVDEVDNIVDSLNSELVATATSKISDATENYLIKVLNDFSIPQGYVDIDTSMLDVVSVSIDTLCKSLAGEIKQKAMFFNDNLSNSTFNILPNIKRAVQKLIDAVGNNLLYSKEKSKRNVLEFVYGEEQLYYWMTMNDMKVCDWCLMQQSLPPRTLSEMPLDHPNGRCILEPVSPEYSNEYKMLLARGEYASEIESFMEY